MLKNLCVILALSFLLVGCTDENVKGNVEKQDEKEMVEEVIEKKTAEEYLDEFKTTDVYQERINGIDISFLESVDFEGDEVPEMVLGSNDDITHSNITIYKHESNQWIEETTINYESDMYIHLEPIGKLTYEDGSLKEAIAFGRTEAHATSMSQSFSIVNYKEGAQTIEELVSIPLQSRETYSANLEENKITVTEENGYIQNYIFKNGEVVDNSGNRLGIIINEELSKLVGTTINDYYISLTDSYYEAENKIKENLKAEEDYEGAFCSFYETFFICDYNRDNGGMYAYYITPKNAVTVEELTSIFNQTVEVVKWESMEEGYSYTAEIITDLGTYGLTFDGLSPDSLLEFISYIPNF